MMPEVKADPVVHKDEQTRYYSDVRQMAVALEWNMLHDMSHSKTFLLMERKHFMHLWFYEAPRKSNGGLL